MLKYFIITVDTEGDNLWCYKPGHRIYTRNTHFIPRFQNLCNKYRFKPVYLTNYEMALSDPFVEYAKSWLDEDSCEIGVHLHAWNNPPEYKLTGSGENNPYLIEYPENIMRLKFETIYSLITERFGIKPLSHRAGRWAMNDIYFKILQEFGIKIDCSFTPGIDWSNNIGVTRGGANYTTVSRYPSFVDGIFEIPMTIRTIRHVYEGSLKHRLRTMLKGDKVWMRPATSSDNLMNRLIDVVDKENKVDYIEFMIHSSELMPNGSPYTPNAESVDRLFEYMESVFSHALAKELQGVTLKEYFTIHNPEIRID